MTRKPLDSQNSTSGITIAELNSFVADWLLESELQQVAKPTLATRKDFLGKLCWFLLHKEKTHVGPIELKSFLLYLSNGHLEEGGRFGIPKLIKPLKPISIHGYFRVMRGFFNWLCEEELIEANPMKRIKAPIARTEDKQPISDEHVTMMLCATKKSVHRQRDEAMLLFLLDTGLRACEICSLKIDDIDFQTRSFVVVGKGNKVRAAHFGQGTWKVLMRYLRKRRAEPEEPLFATRSGTPFTPNSLRQLTERLAKVAGIAPTLVGPHAWRRTFAVNILRAGANLFSVQSMLGHTDLQMTKVYVNLANADIESQHRQFSPVDQMRSRSR